MVLVTLHELMRERERRERYPGGSLRMHRRKVVIITHLLHILVSLNDAAKSDSNLVLAPSLFSPHTRDGESRWNSMSKAHKKGERCVHRRRENLTRCPVRLFL